MPTCDHLALKSDLLETLSRELSRYGVEHRKDFSESVLRFTANSLQFDSASANLSRDQKHMLDIIQRVFRDTLPCYSHWQTKPLPHCSQGQKGQIKSVLIEGHTDNVPFRYNPYIRDNIDLSAQRAKAVYQKILDQTLRSLTNPDNETLFAIAGFGDTKPLNHHLRATDDADNRRIDIRFIFYDPWTTRAN